MSDVLSFPDRSPPTSDVSVTLSAPEWLAISLKLAGRQFNEDDEVRGEAKMLRQVLDAKREEARR